MSAPSTRTSASSSWMPMRLTVAGDVRLHYRHQPVLESEVRLRKPAIAVAQVPAPRLFQALFERRRPHTQHARSLAHLLRDGRHVEIHTKVSGIAHRITAQMHDRLARDAHQ